LVFKENKRIFGGKIIMKKTDIRFKKYYPTPFPADENLMFLVCTKEYFINHYDTDLKLDDGCKGAEIYDDKTAADIIWLPETWNPGNNKDIATLAHEVLHYVFSAFLNRNIITKGNGNEPACYLMSDIIQWFLDEFKKEMKKRKKEKE